MKTEDALRYRALSYEIQALGAIYGLLMGLGFVLAAWGADAWQLTQASSALPYVKLILGLVLCLPLAVLAGWLAGRFDSALLGWLAWMVAGGLMAWIAGHIPYELSSFVVGLWDAHYKGMNAYPFVESAHTRLVVSMVMGVVLASLAGALQTNLVEAARLSGSNFRRMLSLVICLPFMIAAGLGADLTINQPLRNPILAMDRLIAFALQTQGAQVDARLAREMHLAALNPVKDVIQRPRQLFLGDYDANTLETGRVLVRFGETWVRCWVISDQPSLCQYSNELFGKSFSCLWQNQGETAEGCDMHLEEPARNWLRSWDWSALPVQTPHLQVWSQVGTVTFAEVTVADSQVFTCRFRNLMPAQTLEVCEPLPEGDLLKAGKPELAGVSSPTLQQAAMLATAFPDLEGLDLTRYNLSLRIENPESFTGQATIVYTNTHPQPMQELYFRLYPNSKGSYGDGSLQISAVRVDGEAATITLSEQDTIAAVALPDPLVQGENISLEMAFAGRVPLDYGGSQTPEAYGIYNYTQGVLALANWYPLLAYYDEPSGWRLDAVNPLGDAVLSDMAFYQVEIQAPAELSIVATGVEIDQQTHEGYLFHRYVSGPARDFFLVASESFQVFQGEVGGTRVNAYYLPGSEAGGRHALQVALDSLEVFNEKFGLYPFVELDIVQAPMQNAGGVEYPGIVLIEADRYVDATDPVFIVTVAHEVAHQWWYNLVGSDVILEPWVDEALATYSSGLYYEFAVNQSAYEGLRNYWQQRLDQIVQEGRDELVVESVAHFLTVENGRSYGAVVYAKGALFFDALRKEIGDEAFFKALQTYYRTNRYQMASASDLLSAFNQASGSSLESLYQEWLFSRATNP